MPSPMERRKKPIRPPPPRNVGRGSAPAPPAGVDNDIIAQAQREALNATTAATVAATNEASRTSTLLAKQTIAFVARN